MSDVNPAGRSAVPDPAVPDPAVPDPAVPDPAVPDPAVPDPAVPDWASRVARLRMSSLGLVSMLIIQFILGVIYSLYGTAPTSAKSVGLFSSPVLALHVILFFLLVIAAVGQLIRAGRARHRLTLWMSALGLVAILAAGFAGIGFASNGDDGASLGMSLAFAVALAAYVVLIFALAPSARSSTT